MSKKVKIEVLFPEIANLYGDLANIKYLSQSCPEIEITETSLVDEPLFVSEVPDLIYMGTMSESSQLLATERLSLYKDRIVELIDSGANFLITGNALEVFCGEVREKNEVKMTGLKLFPLYEERDMLHRFNSLYLGKYEDPATGEKTDIVGYKSQFTQAFRTDDAKDFVYDSFDRVFDTVRGPGLNPGIKEEGIRRNNFIATYIIGPLTVLNPPFAKLVLRGAGCEDTSLACEKEAMEAYRIRVEEYSNPATGFLY